MRKLFLLLALLLVMASGAMAAAIPQVTDPDNGPEVWLKDIYNADGGALAIGDVVVWDTVNSDGDNDNWVRRTTTADTWIVAGVVYPSAIEAGQTGSIAFHGVVDVTVTGSVIGDGSSLCSSTTAGSAYGCASGNGTGVNRFGFAVETGSSTSITSYLTL